jgi:hypothetical protein
MTADQIDCPRTGYLRTPCLDCKRASGGEMATFFVVSQDDFTLFSGALKKHVNVAASRPRLSRARTASRFSGLRSS